MLFDLRASTSISLGGMVRGLADNEDLWRYALHLTLQALAVRDCRLFLLPHARLRVRTFKLRAFTL